MNQFSDAELEQMRGRLEYYSQLKEKSAKNPIIDKWISIYSERVQKLERKALRVGLKTKISGIAGSAQAHIARAR